jgi:hypothetical protein
MGERADGRTGMIVNENGRIPQADKVFANYEAIFYAFYNKELTIDDTDMSVALSECYQLIQIADYLGCTSLISKSIDVALFKHGQDFFRAIAGAPQAWIDMGYRIRSEIIFKECMIHLVGNWKMIRTDPRTIDTLREIPGLRALIEKYHRMLLHQGKNLELAIMMDYPGKMATPEDELPIRREAYTKDILIWLALTFFRHWLSQRLLTEKGRYALDCGYELYKQLGTAGDAYMNKDIVNQFHAKFPMTRKAMNVLEKHLQEIKQCMKELVMDHKILGNNCQLDVQRFPVRYLTCTEFKAEDFPWVRQGPVPRVVPVKREYKPGGNEIARQNLETAKRYREQGGLTFGQDDDDDDDDVEDEDESDDEDGDEDDVGDQVAKRPQVN